MPPEMKRQNAFSNSQEAFKEISCRICYQSETWGEWKRIICQCSIMHDYYIAHEFCFKKNRNCKVCSTPYIEKKPQPTMYTIVKDKVQAYYQFSREKGVEYKNRIVLYLVIASCVLLFKDIYSCTTFTKVYKSDISKKASSGYLWLPVFEVKCFKSSFSSYVLNIYFMTFLSLLIILNHFKKVNK